MPATHGAIFLTRRATLCGVDLINHGTMAWSLQMPHSYAQEENVEGVFSIRWFVDVGCSSSRAVGRSSQMTVTTAVLQPVSQCDVGPPFQSQDHRYRHASLLIVVFHLGGPEITQCVASLRRLTWH